MKLHYWVVFVVTAISSIHVYSQKQSVGKKDFCSLHFSDKKSQLECKKNAAKLKERLLKKKIAHLQHELHALTMQLEEIKKTKKTLAQKRDDLREEIKQKLYKNTQEKEAIKDTISDIREKLKKAIDDYHQVENLIVSKKEEIEKFINNKDDSNENFSNYNDSSW